MAQMDRLTLASIAAQKAGMSYGKYMATLYKPSAVDVEVDVSEKRVCMHCGTEIPKSTHGNRRYCSDYCRYEAGKKLNLDRYHKKQGHTEADREKRVCRCCGQKIPKHMHGSSRYCSLECKHERELEQQRAAYAKKKDKINAKRREMRNGKV